MVAQPIGALASACFILIAGFAGVLPVAAQNTEELLAALRRRGPDALVRSSHYACEMNLRRTQQKKSQGLAIDEFARLEVAFIDGKERYSWPGESSFRDDALRDVLVMGLSGSGSFGGHLRSVVFGEDTEFSEGKWVDRGAAGIPGARFFSMPYRVAAGKSGYLVNVDGQEIEAAIAGELTVVVPPQGAPPGSPVEITGFTLRAVDLPPDFPATDVEESISFLGTGESDAAPAIGLTSSPGLSGVPAVATQRMVERSQDEYLNQLSFSNCREFVGESSIRFDQQNPPRDARIASTPVKTATRPVPVGVPVDLELKSSVEWTKQRTGDPIEAELTRDVRWKGSTVFNEGARAYGRIVELKRVTGKSEGYLVGLQFTEIVDEKLRYPVSLRLEALTEMPKGPRRGIAAMVHGEQARFQLMDRTGPSGQPFPEGGFFQAIGPQLEVPKGFAMRWITTADAP